MGSAFRREFPFVPRRQLLLDWMTAMLKVKFHMNLSLDRIFVMAVFDTFLSGDNLQRRILIKCFSVHRKQHT